MAVYLHGSLSSSPTAQSGRPSSSIRPRARSCHQVSTRRWLVKERAPQLSGLLFMSTRTLRSDIRVRICYSSHSLRDVTCVSDLHVHASCSRLSLGWTYALDAQGKTYYINHATKTTTYDPPPPALMGPPVQNPHGAMPLQHQPPTGTLMPPGDCRQSRNNYAHRIISVAPRLSPAHDSQACTESRLFRSRVQTTCLLSTVTIKGGRTPWTHRARRTTSTT
jgi:hypothetical protein